ncbi:NAD(+)/NADH kinase [Halostella litorea]|uniref:NAD(+)/NADH kinase n=1 Tax=Halostella litorea TaxID=2528831 RepID=UPI0010931AF1|nr:NAD(+)/NADH kinase [Halostella litorea]
MAGDVTVAVESDDAAPLVEAVERAATGAAVRPTGGTADADLVVADGRAGLVESVRTTTDALVLPVDAGAGVRSVPRDAVGRAVADVAAGAADRVERPVLSVRVDDADPVPALFDVTLVTAEPARISEYAVHGGGRRIDGVRADGVVVATPAGSRGYAAAAGGPTVDPACAAVSVTPIAPFVTDAEGWVLPDASLALSVERDEGDVSLLVDGRDEGNLSVDATTRVSRAGVVEVAVVEASADFYSA